MSIVEFQIMSDLHLETPKARPSYDEFEILPRCPHLALLGDIGNVTHPQLFVFLTRQLQHFEIVFFLLGNHEPYGTTFSEAISKLSAFEAEVEEQRLTTPTNQGNFVFLNKTRYDLSEDLTVLGCTLFSSISPGQHHSVARFVSDFTHINKWTVASHNDAHQTDVAWLNRQVTDCTSHEPHRTVIIFTHHSPTMLKEANDPRHLQDHTKVQSAFSTDLSNEVCWTAPQVRLWAFGHTHFNCDVEDPKTGKRIFANQKGYRKAESLSFDAAKVVRVSCDIVEDAKVAKSRQQFQTRGIKGTKCIVS